MQPGWLPGRIWYANRADVLAADDGNPTTVAPIYEMDADLRRITEETYRKRGGKGEACRGWQWSLDAGAWT